MTYAGKRPHGPLGPGLRCQRLFHTAFCPLAEREEPCQATLSWKESIP